MIVIKHRYSNTTCCEFDVKTIREAVEKGKTNLHWADLRNANLYGADLYGANLYRANLSGADLSGADLYRADLSGANLHGANLYRADLYRANLDGADLYRADLSGANLHGANLHGADLRGANLYRANLHGTNLHVADLHGANLGDEKGELFDNGFFSVGPLGSRNDTLQAFHTNTGIWIKTGCFYGSLEAFRAAVAKTHTDNNFGSEYTSICNFIEHHFKIQIEELKKLTALEQTK